jgi:hypothetical protein
MNNFARPNRHHRRIENRKQWTIVIDSALGHVNDHDSECEHFEIVLEFEPSIDRDERIECALRATDDFVVRHRRPTSFDYSYNLMIREGLADARMHAFV